MQITDLETRPTSNVVFITGQVCLEASELLQVANRAGNAKLFEDRMRDMVCLYVATLPEAPKGYDIVACLLIPQAGSCLKVWSFEIMGISRFS